MKYEFNSYQMEVEGHSFWVAESRFLKGCVGQGETCAEAIAELEVNENEWLETAQKYNIPIPPQAIRKENSFSGKISLRISPVLHEEASSFASEQNISLNQYITDAIAYYNGVSRFSNHIATKVTTYTETTTTVDNITSSTNEKNIYQFANYLPEERKQM